MIENQKPNILVVGDLMIDHYLWGSCNRISPEAPVQIVDINKETSRLGGAGNVVNNLLSLGSNVKIYSVLGKDEIALEIENKLSKNGVNFYISKDKNRKSSKKSRIIASHSQVVRFDKESKNDISKKDSKKLLKELQKDISNFDVIILSDYQKGVLTSFLTKEIIKIANRAKVKVLVDPKGKDFSKYKGSYLLTPNKKEAELSTGITIKDDKSLKKLLKHLKKEVSLDNSLVTLSENGIAFLKDKKLHKKPTVAREVYDVTGAGDTVISALAYSLAINYSLEDSIEFANLAAGVVVAKLGAATVTLEEIKEYKTTLSSDKSIDSSIKSFNEIKTLVDSLKKENKKIVFTNGCFDILHKGHVSYLDVSKSYGDVLILGLNSDLSVKKLKGKNRPINNEYDRAFILAALQSVDYVVIFNEDTPYELIKKIKPDILVKGADYEGKKIVGSDMVKETKLVTFVDGKSTTNTISKILGKD